MTRFHATPNGNVPFTPEEEVEWDAMEAEWNSGANDRAAAEVRKERDVRLMESDWVVVKAVDQNAQDGLGIQIPQVWIDYRQALREIPQQDGFPLNVIWPNEP